LDKTLEGEASYKLGQTYEKSGNGESALLVSRIKDVGSSYSNLIQISLWNNSTDTCLGLQIWMNLKN